MTYELHLGDCLEILPTLPDASVDAVITDPPYFLPAAHYNTRTGTFRSLSDLGMLNNYFRQFFSEAIRVLKEDGFMYVFCDGQSYPVFYAICYPMLRRLRPLIWDKMTSLNGYAWRHQHEMILFCENKKSPTIKTGDGDVFRYRAVPMKERNHPAEKPVELLQKLVNKTTPMGGVVLDPFMGSASTGEACLSTGCNFIGIEQDPTYFDIASTRLAGVQQ